MGLGQGPSRGDLSRRLHAARRDPSQVVLEGLHAAKHAIRFGASLDGLWSDAPEAVLALARDLAPDIVETLSTRLETVPGSLFARLAATPPETRLIALARRPAYAAGQIGRGLVVLLDRPRHPGNLGAVIRVAAAADAAAVCGMGGVDPWSAAAVRGAAGLQFALPVLAMDGLPPLDRPLIAFDDEGETLTAADIPADAVLAFGSERDGLSAELRTIAERVVAIPMRAGVSSLNLASAVAVALYARRLAAGPGTGQRARHST
jgi:TrmH family RNA methyltransferase